MLPDYPAISAARLLRLIKQRRNDGCILWLTRQWGWHADVCVKNVPTSFYCHRSIGRYFSSYLMNLHKAIFLALEI